MPRQATGSPPHTPHLSPLMPRDGQRRSPLNSALRWRQSSSGTLLIGLVGLLACHTAYVRPRDTRVEVRARLIRIEDTRSDEPAWLDSELASPDASRRRDAAITAG